MSSTAGYMPWQNEFPTLVYNLPTLKTALKHTDFEESSTHFKDPQNLLEELWIPIQRKKTLLY